MIRKLRRHLTLLFAIPTSLILSLILCVLFFWQFSQTRNEQTISMQNQILNLTYQLEGTYFFSDDWLAGLEHDHRLIIHIEENNVPLFFSGSWEPRTNRDTLVDMAKEMALTEHIDTSIRPFSSPLQKSSIFTLQGEKHDTYQAAVVVMATESGFRSLTLLSDITELKRQEPLRFLLFLLLEICGILALFLVSRFVSARAVAPVAEYHQKQTDFIAAASHELRSPLAVIQNCAATSLSMPGQSERMNRLILSECSRSGNLIRNLLWLTSADPKKTKLTKEKVEIDLLLLKIFEAYEPLCNAKNIRLKLMLPDELLPDVNGNAQGIHQILSIFLDNAITYGCAGNHAAATAKPFVEIRVKTSGRKLAVCVCDHGPGIPDEQKALIFDRFYQSDASRKNKEHFGLGLSIAQSLAEQMDVKIEVADTKGGGCTFRVLFPAAV
jgi:signal transduction histidine kinase